MQAVVVQPGDRLSCETFPDPTPKPGEIVVELKAAAVNRRDVWVRKGVYPFPMPFVPGSDGAGVRRDTGEEVVILPAVAWGDREDAPGPQFGILGGPGNGTYAELIAVPAENVFPKPARLSLEEAAAFSLAGLTAWRALFTKGEVKRGDTVVVLGAGSGVSTFAVSLAAQAGARVLVTSASQEKIDRSVELGAAAGVSYRDGDWAQAILDLTGGAGADCVIDSVGTTWPDSLRCLRKGGRVVVFGATGGEEVTLAPRALYLNQIELRGTTMGSPREFAALLRAIEAGTWVPVIDSVRPLAAAAEAHARMESGEQFGKLVLAI
jgi:NADPH:quinone reductase-like Zn-dependent oxidoreductase